MKRLARDAHRHLARIAPMDMDRHPDRTLQQIRDAAYALSQIEALALRLETGDTDED